MRELLYIEIPTPDIASVRQWLQEQWQPGIGKKVITPAGLRLQLGQAAATKVIAIGETAGQKLGELSVFVWSVQRTTYLKVFRWADKSLPGEKQILQSLTAGLRSQFPNHYPEPPAIDLSQKSIFEALAPNYPLTVKHFQKMPNGEYDLARVYWWEQRWREGVRNPQQPRQVVFSKESGIRDQGLRGQTPSPIPNTQQRQPLQRGNPTHSAGSPTPTYDLIYVGGALGVIHAAVMAQMGYRVLLLERLPFARMNREWNISRDELQSLIDLGLLTSAECESIIAREYKDGFNKFFDGNNPPHLKAAILHTPTVLNVALDSEKLLQLCGAKLRAAGGEIWDETEFIQADIYDTQVTVKVKCLQTNTDREVNGRLLVDAMGSASAIAWQLNGDRAFDSVCPTVGAVIASGFEPGVWILSMAMSSTVTAISRGDGS